MNRGAKRPATPIVVKGHDRVLLAVALVFTIIMAIAAALPFVLIGDAINRASGGRSWAPLLVMAGGLLILRPVLEKSRRRIAETVSISVANRAQFDTLTKVLQSNATGMGPEETNATIARAVEGVRRVVKLLATDAASVAVQVLVAIATAFINNVHLAVVMVLTAPISLIVTYFQIRSQHGVRVGLEAGRAKNGALQAELLSGTETLRASGGIESEVARGERTADSLMSEEISHHQTMATWDLGKSLVEAASVVGVVLWGVSLLGRHQVAVGTVLAAIALAQLVQQPLRDVHRVIDEGDQSIAQVKALTKLFASVPLPRYSNIAAPALTNVATSPAVRFENVSKSGAATNEKVMVAETTCSVAVGRKVAIVGESGAGKSTLLRLAAGIDLPTQGTVTLNGVSVVDLADVDLRAAVAYLPQEPYFFHGSVRQNLLLGCRISPPEDLISVTLHALGLEEDLHDRGGIDGAVMEKGGHGAWNFSGGQLKRLGLARVILCQAPILLLDEPDTGLDPVSTQLVHAALSGYGGTVIAVTHIASNTWSTQTISVFKGGLPSESRCHDSGSRDPLLENALASSGHLQ